MCYALFVNASGLMVMVYWTCSYNMKAPLFSDPVCCTAICGSGYLRVFDKLSFEDGGNSEH
jgi:hypothetical protein